MKRPHGDHMLISELSKELGITPRTIRLYEQMGLIDSPLKSAGGIRLYGKEDSKRLKHIIKLKMLGIPLADIQKLVTTQSMVDTDSEKFMPVLFELLDEITGTIRQTIASLKSLEGDIEEFLGKVVTCSSVHGQTILERRQC